MHVRGCHCDECLPGTPAKSTRVYSTVEEVLVIEPGKSGQNARAYMKRKLRENEKRSERIIKS